MNATNPKLHPDFGYGNILTGGMPYNVVPGTQTKVPVTFLWTSDPGPYPIPSNVNIQLGSDHHALIIDNTNCILYEFFAISHPGGWYADAGAVFPLNSNALRPNGWTSADAAGLPIFPGLIRYEEVESGHIDHALRLTADHTRNTFIWPARHFASWRTGTEFPPMGQRFRLKADFDISQFSPRVQVVLQAAKMYGLILADNGTSWHLSGVGDLRWNDDEMHALTRVTGDHFEAVNETSLMIDPNSGQARQPVAKPVPTGWVNVISKNSGKCLDITGGPGATWQTAPAEQWACLGSRQTNQIFQFRPVTGGYEIVAKNSGLALQLTGGTSAQDGAILEQWPFGGQPYQIWTVTSSPDGYFYMTPKSRQITCADVSAASKWDGAAVQAYPCHDSDNEKWSLVPIQ